MITKHKTEQQVYLTQNINDIQNQHLKISSMEHSTGTTTTQPTTLPQQQDIFNDQRCFNNQEPVKLSKEMLSTLPHNLIGPLLFLNKKGIVGMGTGILISPDLVLTVAHNFYCHPTPQHPQQYYQKFRFYPGQHGPLQTYAEGIKWYIPHGFMSKNTSTTDYALLRLAKPLPIDTFVPLTFVDNIEENQRIGIFGYINDKNTTTDPYDPYKMELFQWGLTGHRKMVEFFRTDKGDILHTLSTFPGQSGAPLLLISQDRSCRIIGVHKGAVTVQKKVFNTGRYLTTAVIEELKKESAKLGAIPFKTVERNGRGKEEGRSLVKDRKEKESVTQALLKKGRALIQQKKWKEATEVFQLVFADELQIGDELMEEGRALLKIGEYKKAEQICRKTVQKENNSAEAHSNLGWALWGVQKYQEGIKSCQNALAIDPNYLEAHNSMGSSLCCLGRKKEAIECYKKALAIDPNYARAHSNMGNSLSALRREKEAIECYKKALTIDPNFQEAHSNMGVSLSALGMEKQSILSFCRAIEINPSKGLYYDNLISALSSTSQTKEAISFLCRVKANNPECKEVQQALEHLWSKESFFSSFSSYFL